MSTDKKPSPLPKLRTFAHDLETTRAAQHREAPSLSNHKEETKKTPARKPVTTSSRVSKPTILPEKKKTPVPVIKKTIPPTTTHSLEHPVTHTPVKETTVHTVESLKETTSHLKTVSKTKTPTTLGNGSTAAEVRDASYEATIITDAKHNRFNFGGALISSITSWLHNFQKNQTDKRKPKYTVPRAERRKGVIQRATSTTARTTTADHLAVLQRIKESENEEERVTTAAPIKSPEVTSPAIPRVSPPITAAEPAHEREYAAPIITYRKNVVPENLSEINDEVDTPILDEEIEDVNVPIYEEEIIEPTPEPEPAIIPIVVTPITLAPIEPNIPDNDFNSETNAGHDEEIYKSEKKKPRFQLRVPTTSIIHHLIENPNQLALTVLSGITVVFVLYIGIQSFVGKTTDTGPVASEKSELFTGATRYQSVFIATNKQTLFDQVLSYKDDETFIFEVVFTGPDTTSLIPANTILGMLGTSLPADFVAEIESIIFGYYRGEPWLILRTNNKNTAYGGMLRWEPELSHDLEPWFGSAVQKAGVGPQFKDGVIETVDVRVLQGADGRERITYGFIGQNNVLITTNTTAFLNLKTNLAE